jgi:hypothetical protein
MIFPCSSARLLLLHPLVLVAVAAFLHSPSLFTPTFSSWTVQLSSPTYLSPDSRVYIRANVLFEDTLAAGIPDDWQVSVLFNGKEMRRFSSATVNYGVIVNDQQWVQISVCLLDTTSRMVACDHVTTLCIPETLSALPPEATTTNAPMHVGTIGFHALAALPLQVEHVLSVSFLQGFILLAAMCDSRLCILSTHSVVSGIWSVHSVESSLTLLDIVENSPSSLASFYILDSCAIFRFGFAYFRIILSDFAVQSIFPLLHFPTVMHIVTCNIKSQCCFFIGSDIQV